ncbi:MAG: endonuclease/exonuclease/phosphatase family protein [Deltaproteobacteria bacterium]|nr:endonuclease/exonuclease/phosphatase family protein [Deltaproteobacteria bacterium]
MRSHLLVALACAGLGACSAGHLQPRAPTPGKPHLTVMTYNVNYGIACDEPTTEAIEKSGADAVFLQETTPQWEACLRDRLSATWPHMAFHHGPGAGGMAVLSKLAFDDKESIPSPIGWFPGWRVVLHAPLGDVQVLQVHLRPQVSDSGSYVSGYFSTGHYRKAEIEQYAPTLDPSIPALVAGDFNEQNGAAIRHLRDQGLRDVLEDFKLGPTWRWPTALGTLRMKLDHMFYSTRLSPIDARVLEAGRSDHLPVIAVFEGV